MKLRCTKINPCASEWFKKDFQVGKVYEAEHGRDIYTGTVDVIGDHDGIAWCTIQKGSKFNLSIGSGPAVTFEVVKGPRRLVVTEKRVTGVLNDKRKFRRMCRQYGKLRFTDPGMFCFIAFAAMKKNARNYQR